jgi:ABC-2 type transport system permease protein
VINQIRAEVLKIRSTRTTLGFVAGTVVLVVAITLLTGLLSDSLHTVEDQRQLFGLGSIAGLFAALAGILVITGEYRFGTIRPTFLVAPSWTRILGAKTVASMVAGVVFAVVGMVLSIGLGYLCLKQRGFPIVFHSGDWAYLLFGVIVGTAIWGGIGVGLGTLIRNQIAAVIVLLAWTFVIENLLFALVPGLGRYGPNQAQNAMIHSNADHLLSPAAGTAVLVLWMLVLVAAGAAWTSRRDVA